MSVKTRAFVILTLLGQGAIAQSSAIPSADPIRLTIERARELALRNNPEMGAARADVAIAAGGLRQARSIRSNPTVDVLTAGTSDSRIELGISQEWEIWGQRGLRSSVASSELKQAEFTTTDAARILILEVDRAFYRAFVAQRRSDLSQELLTLNQRLSDVAQQQLKEGEISKLDFNLAMIEVGRSRAMHVAALREAQGQEFELRRLLALERGSSLSLAVDSAHRHVSLDSSRSARGVTLVNGRTVDDLLAVALARRPDLAATDAQLAGAQADVTLARRESRPNLVPRIATEETSTGGLGIRPGIGFTLPILNRNTGTVEARRATVRQAELRREAIRQAIRTEVESAANLYLTASAEVEVLESTVLAPARENRVLLEAAYREGKVGLPVMLLIRNQVIAAEQEYWSAWLAEREAAALLAAATGESATLLPPEIVR